MWGRSWAEQWNEFKPSPQANILERPLALNSCPDILRNNSTLSPARTRGCLGDTPLGYFCQGKAVVLTGGKDTTAPPCRQLRWRQTGLSSASGTPGSRPDAGVSWGARAGGGDCLGLEDGWFHQFDREEGDGRQGLQNITSWQKYFENRRFLESNNA